MSALIASRAFALLTALMLIVHCPASATAASDYCLADKSVVVLIIDITTEYDDRDRGLLMDAIQRIFSTLEGGQRLVIRTITDSYSSSDRMFDQCVPVCIPKRKSIFGSGCSDGTIVIDKRRMQDGATTAMRERLRNFQARDYSDIIRTLAQIASEIPLTIHPHRIYLFSDLIEHSEFLRGSQFFAQPSVALIERLRRSALIPRLDQARVQVFGVGRSGLPGRPPLKHDQLQKLRDFWTRYFQAANAGSVTITEGLPH